MAGAGGLSRIERAGKRGEKAGHEQRRQFMRVDEIPAMPAVGYAPLPRVGVVPAAWNDHP
jgi:hypothetical protein